MQEVAVPDAAQRELHGQVLRAADAAAGHLADEHIVAGPGSLVDADLAADAAASPSHDTPLALADLLALLQHRLRDWLTPPKRVRLVARFELFLVASREPELSAILGPMRDQFLAATEAALARCGLRDTGSRARLLLSVVDGHLLDCVRSGSDAPLSEGQMALLLHALRE